MEKLCRTAYVVKVCYTNHVGKTRRKGNAMAKLTDEKSIAELLDAGWKRDEIINGYGIFEYCDYAVDFPVINSAKHIEMLSSLLDDVHEFVDDKFDYGYRNNFDALYQARLDGVKFIDDIDGLQKGIYLDTPENREYCEKFLKDNPEYRVENWMNNDNQYAKFHNEMYAEYLEKTRL